MKLSIAILALAAGAHAFNVPPENDVDFIHFRIGHTGVARDLAERDAAPVADAVEIDARTPHWGERRSCHGRHGRQNKNGFLSSLLARLGLSPDATGAVSKHNIAGPPKGDYFMHGDHKVHIAEGAPLNRFVIVHGALRPQEAWWAQEEEGERQEGERESEHRHKEHKHKHGKDKHHKGKEHSLKASGHKLCDALSQLPPALRGFVVGALIGSVLQVVFSLVFLAVRLRRRKSCEARRVRRAERKEARKAAKAAYKANKAAKKSKAAEAGFDVEEALPSHADGETDALVVRQ
ncbi:hypothetical protein CspeluHIS016_0602140 [Cutaneotrichosporon spelunceum]|uniref:Uncharacterized protein n=1 Tax=Cutaneotrichosporon spelunceum TaxID=1672016 RepID=A0AAD3TXM0_9TREE|nr:hypothetical protein CspeluHIS016_0602140 [Cutaneotrichosporon spelunceum]